MADWEGTGSSVGGTAPSSPTALDPSRMLTSVDRSVLLSLVPQVIEYSPTTLSENVSVLPTITATFNVDMLIGTLESEAATSYLNNYVVLSSRARIETCELVFVGYNSKTKTMTFTPASVLSPSETYTVTVLEGFQAASGRGMVADATWKFATSDTSVTQVSTILPLSSSQLVESPVFSWSPVSDASYELQVARDRAFTDVVVSASPIPDTTAGPFDLEGGVSYYWRVRAVLDSVPGQWSETRQFIVVFPTSSLSPLPLFDSFSVMAIYPPGGSSNLSDWSTQASIVFNRAIDAVPTLSVVARHVDTDALQTAPTYTTAVTGNELRIQFSGDIASNTRYTVSVISGVSSDGLTLVEPVSFSFTGPYTPLYSSAELLRADYGRFLGRYTDDEINIRIHKASMKCNKIAGDLGAVPITSLLTSRTLTYDMQAYVEAYAALCLIQSYQYELLEQAGRRTQTDVVMAQVDSRLLSDVDAAVAALAKEVQRLEVVMRGSLGPVTGVRSSKWDPSQLYDDMSIAGMGRTKF